MTEIISPTSLLNNLPKISEIEMEKAIEEIPTTSIEPVLSTRYVLYRILDKSSVASVATSVGGAIEVPIGGRIAEIGAYVDTAGTTGTLTLDVNKNGSSIMTTRITIDTGETSSRTAATAPAVLTQAIVAGDLITVDVDVIQTTASKGLVIRIGIQ